MTCLHHLSSQRDPPSHDMFTSSKTIQDLTSHIYKELSAKFHVQHVYHHITVKSYHVQRYSLTVSITYSKLYIYQIQYNSQTHTPCQITVYMRRNGIITHCTKQKGRTQSTSSSSTIKVSLLRCIYNTNIPHQNWY